MAATAAVATIEPVIERYLTAVKQTGVRLDGVYLFGSFAAGSPHKWSDIDLAVVSRDFSGDGMKDQLRLMRLTWDIDVRIEPHPFQPEEFTHDNLFAAEILDSGIRIV